MHFIKFFSLNIMAWMCCSWAVPAWTHTLARSSEIDTNINNKRNDANETSRKINADSSIKNIYYIHVDHLNTPRVITNENRKKVWQWKNTDPFGSNLADENIEGIEKIVFNLRFNGQYYDNETGMHYNFSRDYDPKTGRYRQYDKIGLKGGLNPYEYAYGNPLMNNDPNGEILPAVGFSILGAMLGGMSDYTNALATIPIDDESRDCKAVISGLLGAVFGSINGGYKFAELLAASSIQKAILGGTKNAISQIFGNLCDGNPCDGKINIPYLSGSILSSILSNVGSSKLKTGNKIYDKLISNTISHQLSYINALATRPLGIIYSLSIPYPIVPFLPWY